MASTRSSRRFRLLSLLLFAASRIGATPYRRTLSFTRQGCFVSNVNGVRALTESLLGDDAMTVDICAQHCSSYSFFGLEYGRECWCSSQDLSPRGVPDADCSFPCAGDPTKTCGGSNRIEVYTNDVYVPPVTPVPAELDVPYLGCFIDVASRALPDQVFTDNEMTAEKCQVLCQEYSYFGLEFGKECFCGNKQPQTQTSEDECSFPCAGDRAQTCGGNGRINVWGIPPLCPGPVGNYEYTGCFADSGQQRTLTGRVSYDHDMTLEKCAAFCGLNEYPLFGVEFSSQCYCGTALDSSLQRPQNECAMRCGGNDQESMSPLPFRPSCSFAHL